MAFLDEDFLLNSNPARTLYHEYAVKEPIFDYHCHLPPDQIAENRRFKNLYEIWLAGDHYKWRAMRTNGVKEEFCTGSASDYDKFLAWAKTVPHTLRNPLYHWTHLELKRYFGYEGLLNEKTAPEVWELANERLATPAYTTQGLITRSQVKVICTTDDPVDSLCHHRVLGEQKSFQTQVLPTFRPDKALAVNQPTVFNGWCEQLAAATGEDCRTLSSFLSALEKRHTYFHEMGCRLSDHGLEHCYADFCLESVARLIFDKARSGKAVDPVDHGRFASYVMLFLGRLDARRGWTKQLHLGAMRNNNTRLFKKLGPDTGFDSIGDFPQARALSTFLNELDRTDELPRTIIYNLNPADNYVMGTMIGNFQDGSIPGKIQFGSGWWFLDQKEAMEWQMNTLSNLGLLSRFVGMLTDSRSFLSYSRHEYFRRVLCNLIGNDVECGELPEDYEWLGGVVRDICFRNAEGYFQISPKQGN